MQTFLVITTILSLFFLILFGIIPFIQKMYFLRPELTIEIIYEGLEAVPLGLSPNNEAVDGVIDGEKAVYLFKSTWKYIIFIRNNSDQTAYNPQLFFSKFKPSFELKNNINRLRPITNKDEIQLKAEYTVYFQSTGRERAERNKTIPKEIDDINILLEYQNSSKRTFYTVFHMNRTPQTHLFMRRKPMEFFY